MLSDNNDSTISNPESSLNDTICLFCPEACTIQTLTNCLVAENCRGLSLLNEYMAETNRNTLNQIKLPHYNAIRKKNSTRDTVSSFSFFSILYLRQWYSKYLKLVLSLGVKNIKIYTKLRILGDMCHVWSIIDCLCYICIVAVLISSYMKCSKLHHFWWVGY